MANLYLVPAGSLDASRAGDAVHVDGEEGRHAVRVSRLRAGEAIALADGGGVRVNGIVEHVGKDAFSVRIDEPEREPERVPSLTLVQALAKGDRDERAVEQATEFGVDAIVPWQAERSVSRWSGDAAKAAKGEAKWQRIAREAAKQSMRARVPAILPLTHLDDLCSGIEPGARETLVLHPRGTHRLSEWSAGGVGEGSLREIRLVVGPEGGLSDSEIERLVAVGARVTTLGDSVLRTSSAGPAALAVLNVALGRW